MINVAENTALILFTKASEHYPVRVYGKDFDTNGNYACYSFPLPRYTSQADSTLKEYPANMRDDLFWQMIEFRCKFKNITLALPSLHSLNA
jgi:hypothetical protein